MKRAYVCVLMTLSLALLLTGCCVKFVDESTPGATSALFVSLVPNSDKRPAENPAPEATEAPKPNGPAATEKPNCPAATEATAPKPTEPPATEPPTTEPPAAKPAVTVTMSSSLPYLLNIDRADQAIYDGPGYDYTHVDTVRERGAYTIVEEQWDWEGNLWGKLKSGAGWVNLTEIHTGSRSKALLSADFADEKLLFHEDYYHCSVESKEYCTPVVFRAHEKLRDVALYVYTFSGEDYAVGADFFTLPELTPEMPLVAELAFPGDMSMYGIRFTDEDGNSHIYSIYISGKDGSLVMGKHQ